MPRDTVHAPAAPGAIGPYSHAASAPDGKLLFLSGQTPIHPSTGKLIEGDASAQARRVFANLAAVLDAAGRTLGDVVKINVYPISMDDFAAVNAVCSDVFEAPFPARTTVAVAGLPLGARVEIEAIASLV